jgi:predicted RNA-binding Zn ribbon-like protein
VLFPVNSGLVEAATNPSTIRLVGGHVAVDFVNTIDDGVDVLSSATAFRAWTDRMGLLPAGRVALADVHDARVVIDAVLRPLARGDAPRPADLRRLAELDRVALGRATLAVGGRTFADPLSAVVHAAAKLVVGGPVDRLKGCGNCTWLFLDLSRNGSRRWCSMEGCGTEVKIRRLTARRRER